MTRFPISRAAQALAVVFGVVALTFVVARLIPGDPAVAYAGPRATPAELEAVRERFGLSDPAPQQFVHYVLGILRGDWGTSLHTKAPVLDDLMRVVPVTLVLVVAGMIVAVVLGVPLGVLAARAYGRFGDLLTKVFAIVAVSMPVFWLAILLQIIFFSRLGWLPVAGQYSNAVGASSPLYTVTGAPVLDSLLTGNWPVFGSVLLHMVLPVIAIAAYPLGATIMATRASILDNLGEEHIRMVRSLGFAERAVLGRFAMRPALNPILSLTALMFAYSLTNSFIVESIFNWPGLGSYAITSIQALDIPAILGVTLFVALVYVFVNLAVDIVQALIDPRVRA